MGIYSSEPSRVVLLIHRSIRLFFSLVCLSVGSFAYGDTVEFQGGRFPVDSLTRQGNGDVLVEVDGHSWLTPPDKVGPSVAEVFVQAPELGRKMPWSNYVDYLVRVVPSASRDPVELAVRAVLTSEVFRNGEVELLAKRFSSSAEGVEILERSIRFVVVEGRYRPTAVCIASIQLDRRRRMALGDAGILPGTMRLSCGIFAVELARQAFLSGELSASEDVLRAALELFGAESNRESDLQVAADRMSNFALASSGSDVGKYVSAFQILAADPLMRGAISAATPGLVRQFAEKALEQGDGVSAIRVLLLLPVEQRTPSSHEIVIEALSAIAPSHSDLLLDPKIQQMLWAYSNKDGIIKERYLDLLERATEELGQGHDLSRGSELIANVRELRPDPSSENDRLRFILAGAAAEKGQLTLAQGIMAGAKTKIPWSLKLSFFLRRNTFFVITPVILLCGLIFLRLERRRGVKKLVKRHRDAQCSSRNDANDAEGDQIVDDIDFERQKKESLHRIAKAMQQGRGLEEYDQLLLVFGLQKGATPHAMKYAYRQAVKTCHPDRNPNADKTMNDHFIEITKQYERLLELYEARQRDSAS